MQDQGRQHDDFKVKATAVCDELAGKVAMLEAMLAQSMQAPSTSAAAVAGPHGPGQVTSPAAFPPEAMAGGADQWSRFNTARAAMASAAGAGGAAPGGAGGVHDGQAAGAGVAAPRDAGGGRGSYAGDPKPYMVCDRNWDIKGRLDIASHPEAYGKWCTRALSHLAKGRPDVKLLLAEAQASKVPIGVEEEKILAAKAGLLEDVGVVSDIIRDSLITMVDNSLIDLIGTCGDGRGLEAWRALHVEYKGLAPQVISARIRLFQYPTRCSDLLKLGEALPKWIQMGEELKRYHGNLQKKQ
jgi:hypothetical protein